MDNGRAYELELFERLINNIKQILSYEDDYTEDLAGIGFIPVADVKPRDVNFYISKDSHYILIDMYTLGSFKLYSLKAKESVE